MAENGVELDSVDVVAPLENLTANALVASEGAPLFVGGLKEKGFEIDAVEGAAAELVGLNDGVDIIAGVLLLVLCWLAKGRESEVEEAGLKGLKLDLGFDSLRWDESGAEVEGEALEVDGD